MCEHAVIRGKCCWAVLSVLKMSPSFLVTEAADRCRLMNSYMLFSYTAWWLKTDRNNQKSVIVLSCKGEFGLKLQLYHLNKQQRLRLRLRQRQRRRVTPCLLLELGVRGHFNGIPDPCELCSTAWITCTEIFKKISNSNKNSHRISKTKTVPS